MYKRSYVLRVKTMITMPVAQARANIRDLLDHAVAGQPVALTRHGKTVAVVVPASFLTIGEDYPAGAGN